MIKKLLAMTVCIVIATTALTACSMGDSSASGDSNGSENSGLSNVQSNCSLVIDGESIDASGMTMLSVSGLDISFDEFRYYWLYYKKQLASLGYDFETDADSCLSLIKYNTTSDLKSTYAMIALAKENGLAYETSSEDLQTAYMQQMMQFQTEDDYITFLNDNGMTDYALQCLLSSYLSFDKAYSALFDEGGKFYVDNDSVVEVFQSDEMARCVHILIPFSACVELSDDVKADWDELSVRDKYDRLQTAYEQLSDDEKEEVKEKSLELAKEVADKAKSGEDFFELIKEYNYDPGMVPGENEDYSSLTGYYFTKDYSFVPEFIEGTLALEVDGVSDVVTSADYGYHIIKRLPVDMDYVNENIDDLAKEYNEINAQVIFNEFYDKLDIEYNDYFDKLTIDSIS